jgi:transposase
MIKKGGFQQLTYIARGVTEELIIEYHRKGYSISSIAENTDVPVSKVMDVLSRLDEESDVEKSLEEIEIGRSERLCSF